MVYLEQRGVPYVRLLQRLLDRQFRNHLYIQLNQIVGRQPKHEVFGFQDNVVSERYLDLLAEYCSMSAFWSLGELAIC